MPVRFSTKAIERVWTQGLATTFLNGVAYVYSGAQPASANAPATGTLIGYISDGGGAFVAGSPTNGLQFAAGVVQNTDFVFFGPASGIVPTLICTLTAGNSANMGYIRLLSNAADDNAQDTNNTRIRIDIPVSTVDEDAMLVSTTRLEGGSSSVFSEFGILVPNEFLG